MPTPVSTPQKSPAVAESPGTWKHPRMAEITRRQAASSFTENNALTILWNATGFCAILAGGYLIQKYTPISTFVPVSIRWYASWAWFAFKLLPIVNILLAFRPLFQKPDDLSDIPLSKDQRKLLGLPKTSGPDTPDLYRTPPRYSRTPSISGSVGSRNGYSGSPLSGRGSPAPPASPSASTFSPIAASPLLQKAMGGIGARRSSFGSPSPLGVSTSSNLFVDSPTNSSLTGKRSSIGLNNKWLYEKGRRASGQNWYN